MPVLARHTWRVRGWHRQCDLSELYSKTQCNRDLARTSNGYAIRSKDQPTLHCHGVSHRLVSARHARSMHEQVPCSRSSACCSCGAHSVEPWKGAFAVTQNHNAHRVGKFCTATSLVKQTIEHDKPNKFFWASSAHMLKWLEGQLQRMLAL